MIHVIHTVYKWPADTPNEVQGDCSVVATLPMPEVEPPKTCQHCKHWYKGAPCEDREGCQNALVIEMMIADRWSDFMPPADFGCTLWEAKK